MPGLFVVSEIMLCKYVVEGRGWSSLFIPRKSRARLVNSETRFTLFLYSDVMSDGRRAGSLRGPLLQLCRTCATF